MDTLGSGVERGLTHQLERLFGNGTVTGMSEEQLLNRFATNRDESAFEALVERHGPMVLGVCRQFLRDPNDVDDAFQATFLVLVRKAGSLRQKDLLGNWLYGVACRVALRSRTMGIRRQTSVALFELVEGRPGDGGSSRSEPVSEAVLRDEERPLVHEEVNRLPQKYRTPIVLCYFEGLTHDQAATRLGWPIGTVKGRLSRARELLRKRLSRRGVAVSGAALAAHLAEAELKASVPASLVRLTLNAALAVVAQGGAAITASSAVSLPVASLTEGVVQTMILAQVRSLVIPILVAAGVFTTCASVVAFQFYGGSEKRAEKPTQDPRAQADAQKTQQSTVRSSDDQVKAEMLRKILDAARTLSELGSRPINPETYNTWSLRLVEAETQAARGNSSSLAAYEDHSRRIAEMLRHATSLAAAGQQSPFELAQWKYFAKEAERIVEELKGANPGGMMMGMPKIRGMMAGREMMGGGMGGSFGAPAGPQAAVAGQPAASGGPAAQKTSTNQAAPAAGAQAQPKPENGGGSSGPPAGVGAGGVGGMDLGGGFGGGDDGPDEQLTRIQIARMSAAISTLDKNPKNLAVIKKLEEPMTMHFPTDTPLEEILKHVKDASKGVDGKRLSIYVDPQALQEAEKTMTSPVVIDLEDVPLRLSLRLVLKQLGLAYCVRDGVVMISTVEGIKQELEEARAEQMGLNPDKFPFGPMGGQRGMGMGGGMGGMGRPAGMM